MPYCEQFRYGADNLGYLICGDHEAAAVDGGAWEEMLAFLDRQALRLVLVTNTHNHHDHTTGNEDLQARTGARFLDPLTIPDGGSFSLEGEPVRVYHTPGHTADAVCFQAGGALISGDTLFNGTIGNCFTGDIGGFYRSIKKLMALPEDTVIYAGHDYVRDSLAFAQRLEPSNGHLKRFLSHYDPAHVCSTLREEFHINPYLRFNDPAIVAILKERGLPCGTEWERWESLMQIE